MNEFERAAWEKRENSTDHPPRRALDACLDDIERGKVTPIQVVVMIVEKAEDGSEAVSTYQAGQHGTLGILGCLYRATAQMERGE